MNELSWLIYAADVAGTAKALAGLGIASTALSSGVLCIVDLARYKGNNHRADCEVWDAAMADHVKYPSLYKKPASDRPDDKDAEPWRPWKVVKAPVLAGIACAVFMCVFPSSGTLYAIAASEMGEHVIESETAGKAINALNAWLDRQITPAPASQ